ncbi:Transcription factor e2f2 [Podila verticillata]|nr:Transcription factor e2f2 [Podila verticillata]
MSPSTHVMAMSTMPTMPAFDQRWEQSRSTNNTVITSHETVPQLVKPGKRGRKAALPAANKPKAAPKDSSRAERSLGTLTKLFIRLLKEENGSLDLNNTAIKLNVQKRRIYDITCVLEGIDLIEKSKNNVRWKGIPNKGNCKTAINKQRKEELLQERARLNKEHARMMQLRAQVDGAIRDTLTNESTARYAYITTDDMKKVDSLQDSLVLAVNTPYETYMQLDDHASDPSKPFVMNLEHKTLAGEVKVRPFAMPPRCESPSQSSSDSSTEGSGMDYSTDDYTSDSASDSDDYSSSSSDDDSDDSSDYSSSSDEDEEARVVRKTIINNHAIISSLPQQEIVSIYSAAMEEKELQEERDMDVDME